MKTLSVTPTATLLGVLFCLTLLCAALALVSSALAQSGNSYDLRGSRAAWEAAYAGQQEGSVKPLSFPGTNGKIAFVSERDGNPEIYTMNADGSLATNITNNPAIDNEPAWSPDGTKIAFVSGRDGDDEIYVMNADGSGVTRLTNSPGVDGLPAWSPDGTRIAFVSARDGNDEIYVMNAGGSNLTRLTTNVAVDGFYNRPAWSPDGAKVAFVSTRDGNDEIYVLDADGSNLTRLTNNPASDREPAWRP